MNQWFVLYAKPHQETKVGERLRAKGLDVYVPLLPRRYSAQGAASGRAAAGTDVALFPRYLFVGLDPQAIALDEIRWMSGLVGFVSFGDEPATVDASVINHIETRLRDLRSQVSTPFRPGERVRLRAGHPLAPLEVIFEKPCSDRKRAYALVEMLGRLSRCQVDLHNLEPVEPLI